MDVLRASQSTSPAAAESHATLDCHVRALMRGPLLLAVLSRQNAHFCYCMRITFAYVFFSIHSNFHFISIFTSAFSCSPCRLLGCLSSDCAKVDSLCAQNACFVKKVKNSNCVSSCFSKALYNHAKTIKIYPVGLNKTPIAGRIGIRASRSSPIRTPKILKNKKWRAFPWLFNTNRKYLASAYPSAKHNFKNCEHFLCQTTFEKRLAFPLLFNINPKHLKQ